MGCWAQVSRFCLSFLIMKKSWKNQKYKMHCGGLCVQNTYRATKATQGCNLCLNWSVRCRRGHREQVSFGTRFFFRVLFAACERVMVVLLASVAILSFYTDCQCTLPTSKAGNGTNGTKKNWVRKILKDGKTDLGPSAVLPTPLSSIIRARSILTAWLRLGPLLHPSNPARQLSWS